MNDIMEIKITDILDQFEKTPASFFGTKGIQWNEIKVVFGLTDDELANIKGNLLGLEKIEFFPKRDQLDEDTFKIVVNGTTSFVTEESNAKLFEVLTEINQKDSQKLKQVYAMENTKKACISMVTAYRDDMVSIRTSEDDELAIGITSQEFSKITDQCIKLFYGMLKKNIYVTTVGETRTLKARDKDGKILELEHNIENDRVIELYDAYKKLLGPKAKKEKTIKKTAPSKPIAISREYIEKIRNSKDSKEAKKRFREALEEQYQMQISDEELDRAIEMSAMQFDYKEEQEAEQRMAESMKRVKEKRGLRKFKNSLKKSLESKKTWASNIIKVHNLGGIKSKIKYKLHGNDYQKEISGIDLDQLLKDERLKDIPLRLNMENLDKIKNSEKEDFKKMTDAILNLEVDPNLNVDQPEPIIAEAEPIVAPIDPIVAETEPIVAKTEPIVNQLDPVFDQPEPIIAEAEPIVDQTNPIIDSSNTANEILFDLEEDEMLQKLAPEVKQRIVTLAGGKLDSMRYDFSQLEQENTKLQDRIDDLYLAEKELQEAEKSNQKYRDSLSKTIEQLDESTIIMEEYHKQLKDMSQKIKELEEKNTQIKYANLDELSSAELEKIAKQKKEAEIAKSKERFLTNHKIQYAKQQFNGDDPQTKADLETYLKQNNITMDEFKLGRVYRDSAEKEEMEKSLHQEQEKQEFLFRLAMEPNVVARMYILNHDNPYGVSYGDIEDFAAQHRDEIEKRLEEDRIRVKQEQQQVQPFHYDPYMESVYNRLSDEAKAKLNAPSETIHGQEEISHKTR